VLFRSRMMDRLANRKDKKKRELEEKEAQLKEEMEAKQRDLEAKQKAGAEERERQRQAKLAWQDRLKIAQQKADEMGLEGLSKEDYCYQELLGKKFVPEAQISDAVSRIQHARHAQEMRDLLNVHYEQRIAVIRDAVSPIFTEKTTRRDELVKSLSAAGSSDEEIAKALLSLDAEYDVKQKQAEANATKQLEMEHPQQQVDLRQKQLQETAEAIRLYSDPEALSRLTDQTKSQEEKLKEYQAKLEKQRLDRDARLEAERREAEAKLREHHEQEVKRLQELLIAEQEEAQRKIDAQRQKLLREREAAAKKAEEESGELHAEEKQRILSEFEEKAALAQKALQEQRETKKSKLQDRLAAKKEKKEAQKKADEAAPKKTKLPKKGMFKDMVGKALSQKSASLAGGEAKTAVEGGVASAEAKPAPLESKPSIRDVVKRLMSAKALAVAPQVAATLTPVADPRTAPVSSEAWSASIRQIESKLERIENMNMNVMALLSQQQQSQSIENVMALLSKQQQQSQAPPPEPAPPVQLIQQVQLPVESISTYQDGFDQNIRVDEMASVSDEELLERESARLVFARHLAHRIGLRDLPIKAARSLPPSSMLHNAFKNSYLYDINDHILYIHSDRFSSSGDIGLVAIHAFSHIKVNPLDMSNDLDPQFIDEFHKNIKILFQDLFKSTAVDVVQPQLPMSTRERAVATAVEPVAQSLADAAAAARASLSSVASPDPMPKSSAYFDPKSMQERLARYAKEAGLSQEQLDRYLQDKDKERDGADQPVQGDSPARRRSHARRLSIGRESKP